MEKIQVLSNIEQLLSYGVNTLALSTSDVDLARNNLLELFGLTSIASDLLVDCQDIDMVIAQLTAYANVQNMACSMDAIQFESRLLGLVTPAPSIINSQFNDIATRSIECATDWLFELGKNNRYIRMEDINKNIMWHHTGAMGDLIVTINLSKPEKDPKQIQAALKAKTGYPACMLCTTNVGFPGNAAHPARQTLRMTPVTMGGEPWHIQFSPYQYYDRHMIALCDQHRPMKVNRDCLGRLLDFVQQYPHYFMGSNAALPIVGGSILTHDHYQGGGKVLPMFNAPIRKSYCSSQHPNVTISTLDWYNSVVRVSGGVKSDVLNAADFVLQTWANYSDADVNILCKTDAQHNAVTPIARFQDGMFIVDMILRNNRTDVQHPFGIYHPTEDLHNIKKEGIGIIEVMGIFILPGRLDKELSEIEGYLTGTAVFDYAEVASDSHPLKNHADMILSLISGFGTRNTRDLARSIVRGYINSACEKILECTAVYKNTDTGLNAFTKFMTTALNCR